MRDKHEGLYMQCTGSWNLSSVSQSGSYSKKNSLKQQTNYKVETWTVSKLIMDFKTHKN